MKRARLVFSSANFLVTVALLGMLFILVNFVASRRYTRKDFTRQQLAALSPRTKQVLADLKEPVRVIVFYQPYTEDPLTKERRPVRLYPLINDLLEEYKARSSKLVVEMVDPEQDIARARQLVKEHQIETADLIIVTLGTRSKQLTDTDLAEYDYDSPIPGMAEPRVKTFKGEDALTSAILSVTGSAASKVWFTSGHGEKSLDDAETIGFSKVKETLGRQDMNAETVTLLERTEIPSDVKLVVIAGPTHRFTEQELGLLQAHLERGGKLLVMLDPLEDTGLEPWLAKWGVVAGQDIVVDPANQLPFISAANLFVTTYTRHPVVEKMKTLATLFPLVRSVRPTEPLPEGVTVSPLTLTSPDGWAETQTSVNTFEFNEGQDLKGPVSIAVAAERVLAPQEGAPPAAARLVVIGDSEFAVNAQLPNAGNRDFLLATVYWLTGQESLIGIGPKALNTVRLQMTGPQLTGVFWFSFLALPLACGALGALMWWTRRT